MESGPNRVVPYPSTRFESDRNAIPGRSVHPIIRLKIVTDTGNGGTLERFLLEE
jgi:hypothetical protein